MSTPRILIWFWSGGGGGSLFAYNLARRLSVRFGARAVTLSLRADDPTLERARDADFSVLAANIVSDRRKPLTTLSSLTRGARILADQARNADLVIVPMNFASAAPLSAGLKQPLVYCAHDPEPHPGDYARMLQRATQTVLLSRARKVMALSEYAAGRLRALGVAAHKVEVAPLQSVFEPSPSRSKNGNLVQLVLAGRMIAYKGVDILADALAPLKTRDDWRLKIAGLGPALDDRMLARFAHPQIERAERAWMKDAELEALIANADVVLAPYRSATQSGVVAQAIAHGTPCIVTPVGALGEQIGKGEAGWIADRADASAFAAVMSRALDQPGDRAEKAAAALNLARKAWEDDHWGWLDHL